jgi:hypothetical protein
MLKLLTGGIDLPKLESRAIGNTRAIANVEIDLAAKYEETNTALADHITKANERMTAFENLVGSRALAEDFETLKLRNQFQDEDNIAAFKRLNAAVASLTKQVEALTAAKLSEVKARKTPATRLDQWAKDAEAIVGPEKMEELLDKTKLAKARKAPKKDAAK